MLRATLGRISAVLLALLLVWGLVGPVWVNPAQAAAPLTEQTEAVDQAIAWLRTQQQEDGSFAGGFGSNVSPSTQVLMAITCLGREPRLWRGNSGASLIDYLASEAASISDAGTAGRLTVALVMSNERPRQFGGVDLLAIIHEQYDPTTGSYDPYSNIWNHALALWGLAAANEAIPLGALTWLTKQQNNDGGWGWAAGQKSDTNSTALAIQALVGGGFDREDPSITEGISFLQKQQLPDGGFTYDLALDPHADANSTAVVIQSIMAAGACQATAVDGIQRCAGGDEFRVVAQRAMDRLLAFQGPDGAFAWQTGQGPNLLATAQAIPALAGVPFPQRHSTIPGSSPAHPKHLRNEAPLSGTLMGNRGGAYVYCAVDHPGDGSDVSVMMTFTPDNPAISRGLGLVAYGPEGKSASGSPTGLPGERKATFSSTTPGTWLVLVYDYIDGLTLHYTVSRY